MSVRHVLLVLTLLLWAVAHSQPPGPGSAKGSQDRQIRSSETKETTTEQQHGTPSMPAPVSTSQTKSASVPAANEGRQADHKSAYEWGLLVVQGLAAIVVAFFTGLLWYSTNKLWKETKNSVAVADKAASAAQDSANAAIKSAETTSVQFVIGNRPQLVVRRIYFRDAKTICYEVANVGGIEAVIETAKAGLVTDQLPLGEPDVGEESLHDRTLIYAGSKHEFMHFVRDAEIDYVKGFGNERVQGNEEPNIFFIGHVAYVDRIGISRRTAFCRRYDFARQRFTPMEDPDPDYEHVD